MTQRGIVLERLEVLDRSRRGYLSNITKLCHQLDENLGDFSNVVKIRTVQTSLNSAWEQYCVCVEKYGDLLDTSCERYQRVFSDRAVQQSRIQGYNERIDQFIASAAAFYNSQVLEEVKSIKECTPPGSVKSNGSRVSKSSVCSSRSQRAKIEAAKALLMQQQAEERSKKLVELEVKRVEMEIKRTELELQHRLELTKLEAEREVMAARDQVELANLEALLAEQEMEGIKWSPNLDLQDSKPQSSRVGANDVPVTKPSHTSTPGLVNAQTCVSFRTPTVTDEGTHETVKPRIQDNGQSQPADPPTEETPCLTSTNRCTATPSAAGSIMNDSLVAIMSSMEKMSAAYDLPHVQVQKFDGSPENYPAFRQRFKQLVETRPLSDAVKMTRLLQFLNGPALTAVQRYEPMPGGLAKALKTLEERFGQPFQVVRACVESLTKGPAIQANDKDSLQRYADTAQVTYDTLESMGYLSEMNIDNLEKVIARLPKWMQSKFAEHLKNFERKGQKMPNFKDVVDFLKERAFVLSHHFFTKSGTPKGFTYSLTATNPESCAMCHQHHPLYRCEVFKSKSPRERNDFVKQKKICFNCISSTKHNSKKCKSLIRCRVEGCGKSHHTLLHFTEPRDRGNQQRDGPNGEDVNQGLRPDQATISMCSTVNSCEVLLQVIPVRVISKSGNQITTFGLLRDTPQAHHLCHPNSQLKQCKVCCIN